MAKLTIPPDVNGYGFTIPSVFLQQDFQGGNSRCRRDTDETTNTLTLKWTINASDYFTIVAFFAAYATSTFNIDLIMLEQEPTEETAILIPDTLKLISQKGNVYVLEAQVEVLPNLNSIACQIGFIPVQTEQGFVGANQTITQLEKFIKETGVFWGI